MKVASINIHKDLLVNEIGKRILYLKTPATF